MIPMLANYYFYYIVNCLTCYHREGKKYEGSWSYGRFNGKGMYTFNNGDIYTGGFLDYSPY